MARLVVPQPCELGTTPQSEVYQQTGRSASLIPPMQPGTDTRSERGVRGRPLGSARYCRAYCSAHCKNTMLEPSQSLLQPKLPLRPA
jgi:hypothetical protein